MEKQDRIVLTLPADPAYIPVAARGAEVFSRKRGFDQKVAEQMGLALEEAVLNALEMGYGGMEGEMEIRMAATTTGIEITVRSLGLPLDPGQLPQYSPAQAGERYDAGGLSFFLVKQLMDDVSFSTHSNGDRLLRLVKRLPLAATAPDAQPDAQPIQDRPSKETGHTGKAPDLAYHVRQAGPEDADDISRLVLRAHGKVLLSEDIYYPARVAEMLESGEMVSFVAVTEADEIFGHGALVPLDSEGRVREMTYGVVNPDFRSQGAMSDFARALVRKAGELGVSAVMVMSVTNHVHSQKAAARFGLKACALLAATSAASARVEKEGEEEVWRIANLVQVHYLNPGEPVRLYLPPRHAAMIEKIYQHLEKPVDPRPVPDPEPVLSDGPADLKSAANLVEGWMLVTVTAYGRDIRERVTQFLQEALAQQIPAIQLLLPLDDPLTPGLTPGFEAEGFFFAGVGPDEGAREYLALQYINTPEPGFGTIRVMDGMAEEIKAYVIQCAVDPATGP